MDTYTKIEERQTFLPVQFLHCGSIVSALAKFDFQIALNCHVHAKDPGYNSSVRLPVYPCHFWSDWLPNYVQLCTNRSKNCEYQHKVTKSSLKRLRRGSTLFRLSMCGRKQAGSCVVSNFQSRLSLETTVYKIRRNSGPSFTCFRI